MKRLLIPLAVLAVVGLVMKKKARNRGDWHGLTEAEVRDRLGERLPSRIPEDRREVVTDRIVDTMRSRGVIVDEDAGGEDADAAEEADGAADDTVIDLTDGAQEAAEAEEETTSPA